MCHILGTDAGRGVVTPLCVYEYMSYKMCAKSVLRFIAWWLCYAVRSEQFDGSCSFWLSKAIQGDVQILKRELPTTLGVHSLATCSVVEFLCSAMNTGYKHKQMRTRFR